MTRYSLKVPQFQIFIGSEDISEAVVGYSFHHPLAEPSTPLIWTGTIEMFPARSGHPRSFFDDEANPSRWLSGLQPIDVYFNGTWWQRFRIKPSGYRYNQDNGQAEIEITDIIGILDSYQPSADAPEFKTGGDNYWNNLAVALIKKQAALMGTTVTVETPPYGIGGIYRVPRSISGSYIKEAQKMAGERGYWMWSDKETIKWAEYPQAAQTATSIVWQRSRKELLTFTRQQGLDPVKSKITVSATHEDIDIDTCGDVYPKTTYVFASSAVIVNNAGDAGQRYQTIASITTENKAVTDGYIYTLTKSVVGNPMLVLFGGVLEANGTLKGNPPEVKGYKVTKANTFGGFSFIYNYTKNGATFQFDWTQTKRLLEEVNKTTYENVPFDAQNASKILKQVVTRSEPYAKFPDGLQYTDPSFWFNVTVDVSFYITERTTTTYTYNEIFRDDIIIATGQKLYEIAEIVEFKEQIYFKKNAANVSPNLEIKLVPQSKTVTTYIKECQGRWKEIKEVWQNKGQSTTSTGYLYGVDKTETVVTAIPEITYRPAPYPVKQKPLLGVANTNYVGVSPYVNSNEFAQASTLTTKAECERYARYLGQIKWQRYYGRELASGFSSTLNYVPFQGVYAGNGAYIRDRFGISLNRDGEAWQFVEDCIGNKTGSIPEIQAPLIPFPALLSSTLNIGSIPNQTFAQGLPISPITISASGGQSPYTFSASGLPSGLSLSTSGVLSGTPSAIAVTTGIVITVTDAIADTDTTSFDITVIAAPTPIAIVSETIAIEQSYRVIGEMSFLNGIPIPLTIGGTYKVIGEMSLTGGQPDAVVGGTYKVISEMSFLTASATYKVIGEMSFTTMTNSLLTKTIAYLKFDDTSSALSSIDATTNYWMYFPSYSATYPTGLINTGVNISALGGQFNRNTYVVPSLETSKFDLTATSFLGIAVWVQFIAAPTGQLLVFQEAVGGQTGKPQFRITFDPSVPTLDVTDSSGTQFRLIIDTSTLSDGSIIDGNWYLFNIELDPISGNYSFRISDSAIATGTGLTSYWDSYGYIGDPLAIPNQVDYKFQGNYVNLNFDEMYFYNAPLNSTEWTTLYNAGAGLQYPF